jgi:esterase/lipase superfamily enzyme
MRHEHHSWISPALGREMHIEVFGHAGARMLVFPTTLGSCYEWRDRHMHEVLADHLDNGWLQIFCQDH